MRMYVCIYVWRQYVYNLTGLLSHRTVCPKLLRRSGGESWRVRTVDAADIGNAAIDDSFKTQSEPDQYGLSTYNRSNCFVCMHVCMHYMYVTFMHV